MPTTVSGTQIAFNDSTTQSTAARGGLTTITLTSAAPNATLTSGSNQLINIVTDATTPISPSITLPSMTTLTTGSSYFVFNNNTPYNVALKDSGGTIRQFIAVGTNQSLTIINKGTATGQWATAIPTPVVSADIGNLNSISSITPVANNVRSTVILRLDGTNYAFVWMEDASLYAQLFTVNTSTKVVTAGNRITVSTWAGSWSGSTITGDSDGAGHALVCYAFNNSATNLCGYFGLSVSGGTLYASTPTTFSSGQASCESNKGTVAYCGYLGSNNAYAFSIGQGNTSTTASYTQYFRGCTVTGTTTVTVTDSASNTTLTLGATTGINTAGSRTSLTDFTFWGGGTTNTGRAIAYTPASNTFTVTTRTNQAQLLIEQIGNWTSFTAGGFMFCTGKAFYGPNVYDITNSGAAGVTSVISTGFSLKNFIAPAYQSYRGTSVGSGSARSSIYISSTQIVALDGLSFYFTCDPSTSTLNLQKGSVISTLSGGGYNPTLLSTTLAVFSNNTANPYLVASSDVGSPIVA